MADKHHSMQTLKNVELIRNRVLAGMRRELTSLRSFVSCTEGNADAVEKLRGPAGVEVLARVTDFVMAELGDSSTAIDASDETGARRKVARKAAAAGMRENGED